jgi:glycosyltransferase involved in cell wall biosynthesis
MYMPRLHPGSRSWTLYQDFATAVRARGHHFETFTDRPVDVPVEDSAETHYLPWRPAPFALDRWAAPLTRTGRLLGTARTLAPVLESRRDLDLFYVEIAYPFGAAADLAISLSGWKGALVVKPTGEDVLTVPEAAYGVRRHVVPRLLVDRTLSRAAAIRCISSLVVDAIGHANRPYAIIPSAVDDATIEAARQSSDERRRFREKARATLRADIRAKHQHVVMALGRLHPFKGLVHLVKAMAAVSDADLVIAGPSSSTKAFGDERTHLAQVARQARVDDRVTFLDTVPHSDVLRTLAGADAIVVPSLLESMNKVCVEAAAVGTPFVVTRTTGVSTYVDEPGVGEIVPPRDPQALATAIQAVMADSWMRNDAAALRFVNKFAPGTVAAALCDLFSTALEEHRGSAR